MCPLTTNLHLGTWRCPALGREEGEEGKVWERGPFLGSTRPFTPPSLTLLTTSFPSLLQCSYFPGILWNSEALWGHQSFHDNFSCLSYQENQPLLLLLWWFLPSPYILLPVYLQVDVPQGLFLSPNSSPPTQLAWIISSTPMFISTTLILKISKSASSPDSPEELQNIPPNCLLDILVWWA